MNIYIKRLKADVRGLSFQCYIPSKTLRFSMMRLSTWAPPVKQIHTHTNTMFTYLVHWIVQFFKQSGLIFIIGAPQFHALVPHRNINTFRTQKQTPTLWTERTLIICSNFNVGHRFCLPMNIGEQMFCIRINV